MKKEYVLLGILSVILLAAGIWIYQIVSEYQKAEKEESFLLEANRHFPRQYGQEDRKKEIRYYPIG